MKIVLVEDEAAARNGIGNMLRQHTQHELCAVAANGEQGFAYIQEMQPELVITDIRMPKMSGLQMMHSLKAAGCKAEFIILSGYSDFQYAQEALQLGACDYILKPVTPEVLRTSIARVEEKHYSEVRFTPTAEYMLNQLVEGMGDTDDILQQLAWMLRIPPERPCAMLLLHLNNCRSKDAFYTGDMAQAMVDAVAAWGGNMTMEDLANYEVKVREPVVGHYKDYTIYSLPPASSGGTHLVEILNILENYDDMDKIGVNSAEYVHRFSEAFKIAFADRAQYMADTDFADVPLAQLTSKDYAAERYSEITDKSGSYVAVEPEELEHYATTSFSVVDQWGNMVACTKTINYGFGSKVGVPGYGFIMNDEMDDFSADPESVNCAEGGKRPLSSMSPSIVLYPDGSPYMTIGSPGATRIFPTIAQVIERMIDYNMDIQDAIDCARIYDNASENICYESGGVNPITPEVAKELQDRGHEVTDKGEWQLFFGGVQGISIGKDGTLRGGADPRRDGKALAY